MDLSVGSVGSSRGGICRSGGVVSGFIGMVGHVVSDGSNVHWFGRSVLSGRVKWDLSVGSVGVELGQVSDFCFKQSDANLVTKVENMFLTMALGCVGIQYNTR